MTPEPLSVKVPREGRGRGRFTYKKRAWPDSQGQAQHLDVRIPHFSGNLAHGFDDHVFAAKDTSRGGRVSARVYQCKTITYAVPDPLPLQPEAFLLVTKKPGLVMQQRGHQHRKVRSCCAVRSSVMKLGPS